MAMLPDIGIGAINDDDSKKQIESLVKQVNDQNRLISNEDRTKIIKDDSGTPRYLQGYQEGGFSNGNVGAKLSQEGIDVTAATSDQLIWSTDFNNLKIVMTDDTTTAALSTITATAGTWTTGLSSKNISHNLGYIPIPLAFVSISGLYLPLPHTLTIGTGTNSSQWHTITISAACDTTKLYIDVWGSVFGGSTSLASLPIKYYLLRETAN